MAGTFVPYLVALGWVALFLLVGVALRAKVPFFQKVLMPSSIIAGILGCIFINLGWLVVPTPTGWETMKPATFGVIVFHLFALGFVGIGLLRSSGTSGGESRVKTMWRGSLWVALMFTLLYSIQSLLGYFMFAGWREMTGGGADAIIGYLFGTGFAQGPGQTIAYASIWEGAPYNVQNAINIGLTFAAVGFFVASMVGVPLAHYGLRKGWSALNTVTELPPSFVTGIMGKGEQDVCARAITHPANVDSFAYHMAIIFVIYLIAYFFGIWWLRVMPSGLAPLGIGLMFFWGMVIAKIVRWAAQKGRMDDLFDEGTIRRYTGLTIDFMVAAVFMGIEFKAIQDMLIPIIVVIVIGTVITAFICIWFGRRAPELGFERSMFLFGTGTGTVATGLLLLRIVDPEFETTVAEEAGMFNLISTASCAPILYFGLPFAAVAGYPMIWILVGSMVAMPILLVAFKLVGKAKY